MVDPTDKDTKHINDQSTGTEGYLEYTKEKEKGKVNQLDVGIDHVGNKKDHKTVVVTIQGQVKTARAKPNKQQLEQVIKITAH